MEKQLVDKKRISITIGSSINKELRERAEKHEMTISNLIEASVRYMLSISMAELLSKWNAEKYTETDNWPDISDNEFSVLLQQIKSQLSVPMPLS
jgi:hypothetical protein